MIPVYIIGTGVATGGFRLAVTGIRRSSVSNESGPGEHVEAPCGCQGAVVIEKIYEKMGLFTLFTRFCYSAAASVLMGERP